MKTKAKLILAMSVLTAGVVAAGATGTFAWFTTNRAAQLNYTSVTAQKNAGNLEVVLGKAANGQFVTGNPATVTGNDTIAKATAESGSQMSDVSSADGYTFAKPIWKTVAGNNQYASSFQAGKWGVDYTTFWFSVKNSGNNALDVYLNNGTAISPTTSGDAEDIAAAKYTRVAIAATTGNSSNVAVALTKAPTTNWLLENQTGVRDQMYVPLPESLSTETQVKAVALPKGVTSFVLDKEGSNLSAVTSVGGGTNQKLCTLASDATAYFSVSVWLEGSKEDDTKFDAALEGKVNITLDLAGVEAAA